LSETAVKIFEKQVGPDSIPTMSARLNLGTIRRLEGKHDQAIAIHEQVVKSSKAKLGPMHPKTLSFMATLAGSYRAAGKHDKALPIIEEVVALSRQGKGDKSPDTASALSSLGKCLLALDRPADAEKHIREALAIRAETGPDQWQLFMVKSQLGAALAKQKKFADAEPLLLAGYEGLNERKAKIPFTDRDELDTAVDRLVEFYKAVGNPEKATEWKRKKGAK
jgi:tetratricopeptide (TPR) repeat protein